MTQERVPASHGKHPRAVCAIVKAILPSPRQNFQVFTHFS
jgi:hypothetical protein